MFSVLMVTRFRFLKILGFGLLSAIATVACQKVPLLAPSGSTITLTSSATALPVNGSAQIIAQLIEPSGTPPHSGTRVQISRLADWGSSYDGARRLVAGAKRRLLHA